MIITVFWNAAVKAVLWMILLSLQIGLCPTGTPALFRLAAIATFHRLKSFYYLLASLVKRDRGWEGDGGAKREAERERERWMYQTAAPCWAGNGKAAGTNMNISADSYSSLYPPPPHSESVSLSLPVSHLFLLSTSSPQNLPKTPHPYFSPFTLSWSGLW